MLLHPCCKQTGMSCRNTTVVRERRTRKPAAALCLRWRARHAGLPLPPTPPTPPRTKLAAHCAES